MDSFLADALILIDRYSFVLYGVGVLGLILYLSKAREALRQRQYTPFPIEREEASAVLRDSLVILVILLAIIGTTFYIDRVLLATPEQVGEGEIVVRPPSPSATSPVIGPTAEISPTPEPDVTPEPGAPPTEPPAAVVATAPPTSTPAEELPPTSTPAPSATLPAVPPTEPPTPIPTQPPAPTSTPVPTRSNLPAASCSTPGVRITSPAHGAVVGGSVPIWGTANIGGFQFYKVEFGRNDSLAAIGDIVRSEVDNGLLATWNAGSFPAGIWMLRLTVVDQTGNFPPPCTIYVVVQ